MIGIAYFPTLQIHRCLFRNTAKAIAFFIETSAAQAGMRLAAAKIERECCFTLGASEGLENVDGLEGPLQEKERLMSNLEFDLGGTPSQRRAEQIQRYWEGDLARKVYLLRRQHKAILENCRRVAIVGGSSDPNSASFIAMEKLLGLGLEVIPVVPDRESLLGLRCYSKLRDVPKRIDIVQVYPGEKVDLVELARETVERGAATFWIEQNAAASREVEEILVSGRVQLVEYENLETEYMKHIPFPGASRTPSRKDKKAAKVKDRMTKNPATVRPEDGLKDAIWKMEHGHFRHLPVVDEQGKLIGMLSDRDIRLIRPSLAFTNKEDAMVQLWSISVQQAAVFDPVTTKQETTLKEAAELMLRWHVGGLPVVDDREKLVGMITYSDLLREFVGQEESQ